MRLQAVPIDFLSREGFLRYGEIMEVQLPDPGRAQRGEDEYRNLTRVPANGWRVAMYCVRSRWTSSLNAYDSRRMLSPERGTALICVAPPDHPANVQLFLLDAAVVVSSGVPHALITLSQESWVRVTENFETVSQPIQLRKSLIPAGIWD